MFRPRTMDFANSRYFSINKKSLTVLGLWPYASSKRYFKQVFTLSMLLIVDIPHIIGLKVNASHADKLMEHMIIQVIIIAMFFKLLAICIADKKMKIMYDTIPENWSLITDDDEKEVLIRYSERGRIITILYMAFFVMNTIMFTTLPTVPIIVDRIYPEFELNARISIFNGEFLVDKETYYWLIYSWDVLTVLLIATVTTSADTAYAICIEHCLGLFAIIKFVGIINNSYTLCFLLLTILHIVALPLSSVLILINLDQPLNLFRHVLLFLTLTVHQLCIHGTAQRLSNASTDLFNNAYDNEWYESSPRTKKLLQIIQIRCLEPCTLTAGGVITMGMETFYVMTKTAVSYITVFASFR